MIDNDVYLYIYIHIYIHTDIYIYIHTDTCILGIYANMLCICIFISIVASWQRVYTSAVVHDL